MYEVFMAALEAGAQAGLLLVILAVSLICRRIGDRLEECRRFEEYVERRRRRLEREWSVR